MAQDPCITTDTTKSQSERLAETFARIDAMTADFESTKEQFTQNVYEMASLIAKARTTENESTGYTGTARPESETKEFFDDPQSLQIKIKTLAQLIKHSKHFVAFTGAGISTSAGIADFRSGLNTVLDTGAGKWAKERAVKEGKENQIKKAKKKTDTFKAIPTKSHMALVGLMTNGPKYLKCLMSQNTDGLHRRSGIPVNQMSELHGNRYVMSIFNRIY